MNAWRSIGIFFLVTVVVFLLTAFLILPLPGQIPVLMYHFVRDQEEAAVSKNNVSRESFERHMQFLHHFGYRMISVDQLYEIITGQRKPEGREVIITFDDGNYTFAENAFPILNRYAFPVTLFLVSDNVKKEAHGSMSEKKVKRLLQNDWIRIGSHSKTHPFLSELKDSEIRKELEDSKKDLGRMFNVPINYLAYPSGAFDERVRLIAEKANYRLAFSTSSRKFEGIGENRFVLRRIKISRTSDHPFVFWLKLSGIYTFVKDELGKLRQWGKA